MKRTCRSCKALRFYVAHFPVSSSPTSCSFGFPLSSSGLYDSPAPTEEYPKPLTYQQYVECLQLLIEGMKDRGEPVPPSMKSAVFWERYGKGQ